MVCFRYVIVNTVHKGDNNDDDDNNKLKADHSLTFKVTKPKMQQNIQR